MSTRDPTDGRRHCDRVSNSCTRSVSEPCGHSEGVASVMEEHVRRRNKKLESFRKTGTAERPGKEALAGTTGLEAGNISSVLRPLGTICDAGFRGSPANYSPQEAVSRDDPRSDLPVDMTYSTLTRKMKNGDTSCNTGWVEEFQENNPIDYSLSSRNPDPSEDDGEPVKALPLPNPGSPDQSGGGWSLKKRKGGRAQGKCEICGMIFHRNSLGRHIREHKGDKPFKCDLCASAFNQRVQLNNHQRVHTEEKPFACSFCRRPCARPDNLKRHWETCKEKRRLELLYRPA